MRAVFRLGLCLLVAILLLSAIDNAVAPYVGVPMPVPSPQHPSMAKYIEGRTCYAGVEQKIKIPEEFTEVSNVVSLSIVPEKRATIVLLISLPQFVDVPEPDISVYKYLEINVVRSKLLTPVEVAGTIVFRVLKEQVDDPQRIVLMKYDDNNRWKELPTEYVKEDAEYYYFKSELESFSLFAIGIKPLVPAPTPQPTPPKPVPETPTPLSTPTPTLTPTPTPKKPIPGFELVVALIALALALWRRNR